MPRKAPATDRTISIINLLAGDPNASLTLSELCRRLGLNKATVHPQLATMVEAGYLQRDPASKSYTLGGALIAAGNAAGYRQFEVIEHARDQMIALATDLDVQCVASARFGMEIVMLARSGRNTTGLSLEIARLPLIPPYGAVFMAWSDSATREEWLQRAPADHSERFDEHYRTAIESIRVRGYGIGLRPSDDRARWEHSTFPAGPPAIPLSAADYLLIDLDPYADYAINVIVAPVFGPDGRVIIAITMFDFPAVISGRTAASAAERLVQTARRVTKAIHGRSPLDDIGQSTLRRLAI